MSDQWQAERSGPGVLERLLVPQSSTKPAVTAFLAGLAGAGAFVASLVLDWQRVSVVIPESLGSGRGGDEAVVTAGLLDTNVVGLVYVLGMLGLLTMIGAVLVRPELALRMRLGVVGLAVGLVGIVAAYTLGMPENIMQASGFVLPVLFEPALTEMLDNAELAYEPGLFAGYAAVVLLAVAAWLAAAPAARAAARWAAFTAANPDYARYHGTQFPGGYIYPPPGASQGSVAPTQTENGAAAPRPVPVPAPSYPPPAPPSAPLPASAYAPPPPPPLASTYAPAQAPAPASTSAPPPPPSYAPPSSTWTRAGHVDELTVTPSEPLDPGTNPDVWRG